MSEENVHHSSIFIPASCSSITHLLFRVLLHEACKSHWPYIREIAECHVYAYCFPQTMYSSRFTTRACHSLKIRITSCLRAYCNQHQMVSIGCWYLSSSGASNKPACDATPNSFPCWPRLPIPSPLASPTALPPRPESTSSVHRQQ